MQSCDTIIKKEVVDNMMRFVKTFMYVDRMIFLRSNLLKYLPSYEVDRIMDRSTSNMNEDVIEHIAKRRIHKYCVQTGSFSFVLGSVGAWLWPLDYLQFYIHSALLAQELYYLYAPANFLRLSSESDVRMMITILFGATSSVKTAGSAMSSFSKYVLKRSKKKMTMSMIPAAGGVVNSCMSYMLLQSLAEEFVKQMKCIKEDQLQHTTAHYEIKEIMNLTQEEPKKQTAFCNLEKLRELYAYVDAGYITRKEFELLKKQV